MRNIRSVICSVPKSGTYLLSEIVNNLGVLRSNWHVSKEELSDYNWGSREEHRRWPERFRVVRPFDGSLTMLPADHHLVSHLPCEPEVKAACQRERLKTFFLYRDLRDCAISYMRFLADTGRDCSAQSEWIRYEDGPARFSAFLRTYNWFFRSAAGLTPWKADPVTLSIRFETLAGDCGIAPRNAALANICTHLNLNPAAIDLDALFQNSFAIPTLTWSGRRTERSLYWSPEADELFSELGGAEVNADLGYRA